MKKRQGAPKGNRNACAEKKRQFQKNGIALYESELKQINKYIEKKNIKKCAELWRQAIQYYIENDLFKKEISDI